MMGTEWVVVQHVPSDYQVSIDSFIGIFTLLLNRYLAVYQLNTFAIYLGNLFFTLQAENAGLLYLLYNRSDRCYRVLVKDSPGFTA